MKNSKLKNSKLAIRTKDLGKQYQLGNVVDLSRTLREAIVEFPQAVFHKAKTKARILYGAVAHNDENQTAEREARKNRDRFWALRHIDFEVNQGEVVGIIGRNGAGKSTLLKILSRITTPTEGFAELYGRVGSLLEVGTGFHPELTGKENIYLNGSILGMRKKEIDNKFDEIVEFAGVEKFIDTPFKRYSSGMRIRLGFAVAAHLETEILIVDEVLAVGDYEFQRKCLGKMEDVAKKEGRTILLVSHNMDVIEKLCNRAVLLQEGHIVDDDNNTRKVIDTYLKSSLGHVESVWENAGDEFDNPWYKPLRVTVCDQEGNVVRAPVRNDDEVYLRIEVEIREVNKNLSAGFVLTDEKDTVYFKSLHTDSKQEEWPKFVEGLNVLKIPLPQRILNEGKYWIKPSAKIFQGPGLIDPKRNHVMVSYEILGGLSDSPRWTKKRQGILAPVLQWETETVMVEKM